jgi:hypothetical protein
MSADQATVYRAKPSVFSRRGDIQIKRIICCAAKNRRQYNNMVDTMCTKPKPYCFVLMPFSKEFDDVYNLGIRASCSQVGAYCERVDEQIFQGTILERIYNQIAKADFIVADMTGRNPNVFYEVGYAHALDKPTILLTQDANDIPFDLRHFPHIVYQRRITTLIDELTRRIRWFVENPKAGSHVGRIEIDLYLGQYNLSGGEAICTVDIEQDCFLDIRVENTSGRTLRLGDYGIGVIAPTTYLFDSERNPARLTDGRNMYMLSNLPVLFPGCSASVYSRFEGLPERGGRDRIIFRVFTDAGSRDYPLAIERQCDPIARQRLLTRAVHGSEKECNAALLALAEIWPDDDTHQFVLSRTEDAPQASCRRAALEVLVENWPNEDAFQLVKRCYREDPNMDCRLLALKLLARVFPGESTSDLLRAAVANAPTQEVRGLAFSLLGGLHSEFGRMIATTHCDGGGPYMDPLKPIPAAHIRATAERASVSPPDIDTVLTSLKAHLRWDIEIGLKTDTQAPAAESVTE